MVNIAKCPEHGLHGDRAECFVCGGPVEQVPMVPAAVLEDALKALAVIKRESGWSLGRKPSLGLIHWTAATAITRAERGSCSAPSPVSPSVEEGAG